MSKKSFKDNPAMAFISQNIEENTQYQAQQDTQYLTQEDAQEDAYQKTVANRQGYVRTQGRKGYKKPRINLAFDSEELLERIRTQSNKEGKSITQFVNEAVIMHLNNL